ncbi:Por secretion system C-terminal sorting domain-containing protein [Filimonas lacunae]|uniref:Por secretion system C-terminal sorting domain-containing protein n=1 Tax=Filimonas lacunae TaxID=477680 RepID=A0A173MG85_9BACT|nr:T9SS type A sorting domain-containing protein [Filimonas lacunae]BAV06499.1 internalin [Filimonas lacunae]SIT27185.1 Por secretion system C-terminal sorting domain-containing protein [Filimonas lacunae]
MKKNHTALPTHAWLLAVMLLGFLQVHAQSEGRYRVDLKVANVTPTGDYNDGCINNFSIFFRFTDKGTADSLVFKVENLNNWGSTHTKTLYFAAHRNLYLLNPKGSRNDKGWVGGCHGSDDAQGPVQTVTLPCVNKSYGSIIPDWNTNVSMVVAPERIDIYRTTDMLPTDTKIAITATWGFPAAVYNWQYGKITPVPHPGGTITYDTTWYNVPDSLQGKSTLNVCGEDIFGQDAVAGAGQPVTFRVASGCATSNTLLFTQRLASPHIVSVTPIPNVCWGQSYGSFKIKFDRQLIANEKLYLGVNGNGNQENSPMITALDADSSYTFPAKLAEGTYNIDVLGFYPDVTMATYTGSERYKATLELIDPTRIRGSIWTHTDVNCFAGQDGTVMLAPYPPLTNNGYYQAGYWHPGSTDTTWVGIRSGIILGPGGVTYRSVVSDLPMGSYAFALKTIDGCYGVDESKNIIVLPVTITQPAAPLVINDISQANPLSFGSTDGNVQSAVAGGTAATGNYSIAWLNSNSDILTNHTETTNPFITTLQSAGDGVYTLIATDDNYSKATGDNAKGCYASHTYTLVQPPLLQVNILQQTPLLCYGFTNASLYAAVTGGLPIPGRLYNYVWQKQVNSTWTAINQTDSIATNLAAGMYKVIITDQNNISKEATFEVLQPDALQYTSVHTNVFCNNGSDGSITLTATGGTQPYNAGIREAGGTTAWTTFSNETLHAVTGLPANSYVIQVKDANNCIMKDAGEAEVVSYQEVTQPTQKLTITNRLASPPLSFQATDGYITLQLDGGTPVSGGTYHIAWTDAQNAQLSSYANTTNPFTSRLNNLGEGRYAITAVDANYSAASGDANKAGCFVTDTFNLVQPPLLTLSLEQQNGVLCNNYNTGILYARVNGGMEVPSVRYRYQWLLDAGSGYAAIGQTDSVATSLKAGNYKVIITDQNGITREATHTITQPTALTYTTIHSAVLCNNGADGIITVNAAGGSGKYQLYWNTGGSDTWKAFEKDALTYSDSALTADTYTLYVKDSNDCVMRDASFNPVSTTITITQPAEALQLTDSTLINPLAFGSTDGSVTIRAKGGTPDANGLYTTQWTKDGSSWTTFTNTQPPFQTRVHDAGNGVYALTLSDINYSKAKGSNAAGCITTGTYRLVHPTLLTVQIIEQQVISCNGVADGVLYAKAEGGIEFTPDRYQYQWQQQINNVWSNITRTDSIAGALAAGNYKIIITDKNGIQKEATYTLQQPDVLTVQLSATQVTACHNNDGSALAVIAGGTKPYHIEWSNGDTTTQITQQPKGKYLAFVNDARGCYTQKQVALQSPNPIIITDSVVTQPLCYNYHTGAISYQVSGGQAPYQYTWSNGSTGQNITNLAKGNYTVTITDAQNCTEAFDFTITEPNQLVIELGPDRTLCRDQVYQANALLEEPGISYQWTASNGFTATIPVVTLTKAGKYYVTATNTNGCTASDNITISVSDQVIAASFAGSTQSFTNEDVVFVNISNPAPDWIKWEYPAVAGVTVKQQDSMSATVSFRDTGIYIIQMHAGTGVCEQTASQPITIIKGESLDDPGTTTEPFIKTFYLAPNPNNGQFKVVVSLQDASQIQLRLIDISSGRVVNTRKESGQANYELQYVLSIPAGTYALVLETPKGSRVLKVLIL